MNCCSGLHGETTGSKFPADSKHVLVVTDKNSGHRAQVKEALLSFYTIVECEDPWQVENYISANPAGAVLVSCDAPEDDGIALIRRLRRHFAALPVLAIVPSGDTAALMAAQDAHADGWLIKPYLRSALIRLVSGSLNAAVERQWETLAATQAAALKGTVEMFNGLSDLIERGDPIVYDDVNAACTPLVEAVNSGSYKGILGGVRDHDNYTYAHSLRVAVFLALFGQAIGLPKTDQCLLATGGLLHDVGKMFIPHSVLNKPGRLTEEEFTVMKGHVSASVRLLEAGANIPKGVIIIAGQHHEKLDGTGYPKGLAGGQLNELARMASIVDVFSALTDRRVYKPPMTPEKALAIMSMEMTTHLDMGLLSRFRQMLLDAAVD